MVDIIIIMNVNDYLLEPFWIRTERNLMPPTFLVDFGLWQQQHQARQDSQDVYHHRHRFGPLVSLFHIDLMFDPINECFKQQWRLLSINN